VLAQLVLIVSDDQTRRDALADLVSNYGLRPVCCQSLAGAGALLNRQPFGVVLCDDELPDGRVDSLIREKHAQRQSAQVIVISRRDDWNSYLTVMSLGAFDYVTIPFNTGEVERCLWMALSEPRASDESNKQPVA
jgi:DNA-binding NtrC family response regulator